MDAELFWGDERLELARHALGVRIGRGEAIELPCAAFVPVALDEGDVLFVVPPRAHAWVRTLAGWRDLATLRVLGLVAPHPTLPGAALVRVRPVADGAPLPAGVVLARQPELWLGVDGFWLRLAVSDEVAAPPPRRDLGLRRRDVALAAFVALSLAAVLGVLALTPPRISALAFDPLEGIETVTITFDAAPPAPPPVVETTKHDVPEDRAFGGEPVLPSVPAPIGASRPGAREGRGRRRPGLEGVQRAVSALAALGSGPSPFSAIRADRPRAIVADALDPVERLATLRGSVGDGAGDEPAASWAGPLDHGAGGGRGRRWPRPRASRRPRPHLRAIPICERRVVMTHRDGTPSWSCHGRRETWVSRVVRAHRSELRFCHALAGPRLPPAADGLTLRLEVAPDGSVSAARVEEDPQGTSSLAACLTGATRTWRFERGTRTDVVRHRLRVPRSRRQ